MSFFKPVPKHDFLVDGIVRLGRVCYWSGVTLAALVLLYAAMWFVDGMSRNQGGLALGAVITGCIVALIPFSVGRGLRYVMAGE